MTCVTPKSYPILQPATNDTVRTKEAKRFLLQHGCPVTPLADRDVNIEGITQSAAKKALQFFTPTKNTDTIYRWKIEGDEGAKRLIGKSSAVKKRLSAYFSAIRKGETKLAKLILKSVKLTCISFGVIASNVPEPILGRVEDLIIKVKKAESPLHLLNERAGGGGASKRKALTDQDNRLIDRVIEKISLDTLPKLEPLVGLPASLKLKRGVVYNITNIKTGKHYVGKTQGVFSRRMSQHMSAVKTQKREMQLHKDIRNAPEDFFVRILYQAPAKKVHILEEIEHAYIKALKAFEEGYNKNSGTTIRMT